MEFRLPRAALATVSAAALVLPAASAASALELPPPVVQIVSPTLDEARSGLFTLAVSVDLAGNASIELSPRVHYGVVDDVPVPSRTVTAEQCPQQCVISFEVNPTTWESPLQTAQTFPFVSLDVYWSWAQGNDSDEGRVKISYVAPVDNAWVSALERDDTPNTRGYFPVVMDTGGSLVVSGRGARAADEVLEARVYTGEYYEPLPTPVLSATGSWDPDAQPAIGRIRLDTANLAAGTYRVLVRARDTHDHYGPGSAGTLTIRHRPVVEIDRLSPFLLAGSALSVGASVNRPLPDGVVPGTIQVSVDGGPAQVLPVPFWNNIGATSPDALANPIQGSAPVLAALLPDGVRTVTAQVLDTLGRPLGVPATEQVRVVTLTEQASVPTMVVGQTSAVTFRGTAPAGMAYDSCTFFLREAGFTVNGGGLCSTGDTSYTRSLAWTPQTAGRGEVEFSVRTLQGVDSPARRIPLTVYAHRTASVGAVSSAYGTRSAAAVTVRDLTNLTSPTVAASGASVVLQRKAAGSSTWVSVGSGRTGSTGRALVPFTNTASGRLRAVVASSVPGRSVVTSERTVTSVSTVSWSKLPTSTRSGVRAYASVMARPYQRGALVRVQARHSGACSWRTLGSALVSSTGAARAGFRLYTRGTWQVRVVRVATMLRTSGYSTVRRVAVR
jgi:hypothetical protein